jgi:hypothetical protein
MLYLYSMDYAVPYLILRSNVSKFYWVFQNYRKNIDFCITSADHGATREAKNWIISA